MRLAQGARGIRAFAVDLVETEDGGNARVSQRLEQGARVRTHAVRRVDQQHRAIQRPQRALYLGGEIRVSGRVQ